MSRSRSKATLNRIHRWPVLRRWLKFNVVGLTGIVVQLFVLEFLVRAGMGVQTATFVAVECAVLNNFAWHVRYTWRDRPSRTRSQVLGRCFSFHLTNGALSLAASWTLMGVLTSKTCLPLLISNLICIAACSLLNFLMAEVVVFGERLNKARPKRNYPRSVYAAQATLE